MRSAKMRNCKNGQRIKCEMNLRNGGAKTCIKCESAKNDLMCVFSSFQDGEASVVCLSVNFCANRFFSQTNGRIATKLLQDGLQVSMHPGCAQGQGQRSRDTDTFVLAQKLLLLPSKWPDRDQTCSGCSPGEPASRVCSRHRLLKLRTDGGQSPVREPGSIDFVL